MTRCYIENKVHTLHIFGKERCSYQVVFFKFWLSLDLCVGGGVFFIIWTPFSFRIVYNITYSMEIIYAVKVVDNAIKLSCTPKGLTE